MKSKCDQLIEINTVSALLRRNGYSFSDHGTSVVVNDPVHRIVGGKIVPGNMANVGPPGGGMSFLHSAVTSALTNAGGSFVVLDKGATLVGAKSTRSNS